jgi:hypothetical protein
MSWFAIPTPMMEPTRVCELDCRQPQGPGAEVPKHRRDQQREHHRETRTAAHLQDQLDRQ